MHDRTVTTNVEKSNNRKRLDYRKQYVRQLKVIQYSLDWAWHSVSNLLPMIRYPFRSNASGSQPGKVTQVEKWHDLLENI